MEMTSIKKNGHQRAAGEHTPLFRNDDAKASSGGAVAPTRTPLHKAPAWKFWSTLSTTHRFYLLLLMSCIPFGGHFVKNGMSSLEQLMLDDPTFPISNTMYGALISAVSVPNMFIPLFGGHLLDKSGHRSIIFFLIWICVGQAIFAIGMELKLFWLALFGRVFFGVGEGSVVVGARVFIAYWFRNRELTFAMGVGVAVTNISKMLAKATVAPVAIHFGGYVQALWYGVLICLVSVVIGIIVVRYTTLLKRIVKERVESDEPLDPELHWLKDYAEQKRRKKIIKARMAHLSNNPHEVSCESVQQFSRMFWTIAVLHVMFINVFHLFQNVSSSFLYQRYGYSIVKSGVVSSISHSCVVFAPFIGLFIDQFGGRMFLIIVSSMISILAYALMIFTDTDPIVSMVLISICLSFTPTILIAAVAKSVSRKNFGAAFGIVEITDAIGASVGNIIIGYLRDETGSYDADMYLLLGMAVVTFLLSLVLIYEDRKTGWTLSAPSTKTRALSMDDDEPPGSNSEFFRARYQDSGDSSPERDSAPHTPPKDSEETQAFLNPNQKPKSYSGTMNAV
ncbi:Major facilitator superfamily, partial [Globisporangium splendens]